MKELTIKRAIENVLGKKFKKPTKKFLAWPPDTFAVCATLLSQTGAYVKTVNDWPPEFEFIPVEARKSSREYNRYLQDIGWKQWRVKNRCRRCPKEIRACWRLIYNARNKPLDRVNHVKELYHALLFLLVVADEASASFWIGGIYEPGDGEPSLNAARVWMDFSEKKNEEEPYEVIQPKHHRWVLNPSQIRDYGIDGVLGPSHSWWENIAIENRTLNFIALNSWLVFATLVCEDLARPDPVGDIIRAVGPNLVFALLQDGPQISNRWSARYSTVLADDPGCSVLALTGIGMVNLSARPEYPPSRVVAVWKQPEGKTIEISLEDDSKAIFLALGWQQVTQWTVDGRSCGGQTGAVRLSGVHQIT